jgi:hypothetical protein
MPGTRVRPKAGPSTCLVPGIHALTTLQQGVDGRDKPGHDVERLYFSFVMPAHSGPKDGVLRTPMSRASTSMRRFSKQGVDGRDKPGHDGVCLVPDLSAVMPGFMPGIHVFTKGKTWMAGTRPAMTLRSCASHLSCPRIAVQRTACFARLCRGHPRLCDSSASNAWMAGTSPAMTVCGRLHHKYSADSSSERENTTPPAGPPSCTSPRSASRSRTAHLSSCGSFRRSCGNISPGAARP